MSKLKLTFTLGVVALIGGVLILTQPTTSANSVGNKTTTAQENTEKALVKKGGTSLDDTSLVLEGDVGTTINYGSLTFVREEDNIELVKEPGKIIPRASMSDFSISLSGTEKSQPFNLAGSYKYAKVWIKNTGITGIKFTITKGSPTGSIVNGSSVTIPSGAAWSVYSDGPWSNGTYYANFTSGTAPMKGQSACRIASSLAELDL